MFLAIAFGKSNDYVVSNSQSILENAKKSNLSALLDKSVSDMQLVVSTLFAEYLAQYLLFNESDRFKQSTFLADFARNYTFLNSLGLENQYKQLLAQKIVFMMRYGSLIYEEKCAPSFFCFDSRRSKIVYISDTAVYEKNLSPFALEVGRSEKKANLRPSKKVTAFAVGEVNDTLCVAIGYEDGIVQVLYNNFEGTSYLQCSNNEPYITFFPDVPQSTYSDSINALAFNEQEKRLYIAHNRAILLYSVDQASLYKRISVAQKIIKQLAIDKQAIMVGFSDKTISNYLSDLSAVLVPGEKWSFTQDINFLSVSGMSALVGTINNTVNNTVYSIPDVKKAFSETFNKYDALKNVQLVDEGLTKVVTTATDIFFYGKDKNDPIFTYLNKNKRNVVSSVYDAKNNFLAVVTEKETEKFFEIYALFPNVQKVSTLLKSISQKTTLPQTLFYASLMYDNSKSKFNLDVPAHQNLRKIFDSFSRKDRRVLRDDFVEAQLNTREKLFEGWFVSQLYKVFIRYSSKINQ